MKHKLLLINLLLIGLVAASGSVLRQKWLASQVHEETVMKRKAPVAPAPVIAPIPSVQPASPAAYNEVAQKLLTARDRNPNIFIEPPPKVEEKPMPPLPFQYGVIDFGAGPTVMLAEKTGAAQHGYHIGDKIGPFKLLGVNRTDILFEWDGKPVQKKLSDLVDKTAATAAAPAVPPCRPSRAGSDSQVTWLLSLSTEIAEIVSSPTSSDAIRTEIFLILGIILNPVAVRSTAQSGRRHTPAVPPATSP